MTRWRAAGIHLLVSAIVLAGTAGAMVLLWYPPSLFGIAGADRLLLVLAIIDLSVGPLLTLLVYRHGKRGMAFDLAVIAVLQAAFFCYGAFTFWASRPVFLVGAVDRFELVFANQVSAADLKAAAPPWNHLGAGRPRLVGLRLPRDAKERSELLFQEISGRQASQQPRLYRDYRDRASALLAHGRSLDALLDGGNESRARTEKALRRLRRQPESLRWLPLTSSRGSAVQLVDAVTGLPIATLAIDPWQLLSAANPAHGPSKR